MMEGGGDLLPRHQEPAITHGADHLTVGKGDLGADRGRHAIAHGAVGRADEALIVLEVDEARRPGGEVAGVTGEDRVRFQQVGQIMHHLAEVERPGIVRHHLPGQPHRPQRFGPAAPRRHGWQIEPGQTGGKTVHIGHDPQRRPIDPPDFPGIGIDMHDRHCTGLVEQGVALRHRLTQAGTDGQDQVGLLHARHQGRIGPDAQVAHEILRRAVIGGLAAEGDGHRDGVRRREAADRRARGPGPG